MDKSFNPIPDKSPSNEFTKETLSNGDVYIFSSISKDKLLEIVRKISQGLGQPEHEIKAIISEVGNGKDWRIDGTFNLKISNNKLTFDNRNGRGIAEYKELMKKIVDSL